MNPVWDEFFEAVVDQASGQKLIAETYDDDPGSNDDFLGRMNLDLAVVKEKGVVDEVQNFISPMFSYYMRKIF